MTMLAPERSRGPGRPGSGRSRPRRVAGLRGPRRGHERGGGRRERKGSRGSAFPLSGHRTFVGLGRVGLGGERRARLGTSVTPCGVHGAEPAAPPVTSGGLRGRNTASGCAREDESISLIARRARSARLRRGRRRRVLRSRSPPGRSLRRVMPPDHLDGREVAQHAASSASLTKPSTEARSSGP